MIMMNWMRQAAKVQKMEKVLHLYRQVPMNMKMALRQIMPREI